MRTFMGNIMGAFSKVMLCFGAFILIACIVGVVAIEADLNLFSGRIAEAVADHALRSRTSSVVASNGDYAEISVTLSDEIFAEFDPGYAIEYRSEHIEDAAAKARERIEASCEEASERISAYLERAFS